tara:strand:+ start:683 stop:793 length:111 start_codon:yes stop_codon:yes gene_type:complete
MDKLDRLIQQNILNELKLIRKAIMQAALAFAGEDDE